MRLSAIPAALIAAALACAPLAALATPHVLVWADGLDINVLNPFVPGAAPNVYLSMSTMAFLTTGGNGALAPELAVRVPTQKNGGISADGKTLTYELRPNLKWSDGQPLTSEDVAFSVVLINDSKTNISDRTGYDLITRIDTPTKTKVVMHLAHPYGPIVSFVFSDLDAPVLPKHLLAGKDVNTADYMQLPVGAGPFRYTKWLRGDRVELEANPYYFRGAPKLKKIVFRIIPSSQSAAIALQTGESDMWPGAALDEADLLKDVPSLKRITLAGVRPAMLMFNTTSPAVSDVRVRNALRLALNRASIIQRSYRGGGELDESIVSKNDPAFAHIAPVAFDDAKAEALLDAAGWKAGADGIRMKDGQQLHITLVGGSGSAGVQQILELVRADWQRIGAVVDTRYFVASMLFSANADQGILMGGKFDVALFSYGQIRATALASTFTCANVAPKGSNFSRTCDRELESLFARYDATYDDAAAARIAGDIQRRLNDLLPAIIIAKRNEYYVARDTITGYQPQPFSPFAGGIMNVDVAK
jgi:peptide/nickel transport system substrate-binding protein